MESTGTVPDLSGSDIIRYRPSQLCVGPSQVARYFGGARYAPGADMKKRITDAVGNGARLITPAAAVALHKVAETTPRGDLKLACGLALPRCAEFAGFQTASVAAAVATLGPRLEQCCRQFIQGGDLFSATLMDAVGVAFLDELGAKVHHDMTRMARSRGLHCGCRMGPGLNGLPVEAQSLIFKMVDARAIGVVLNDSLMMQPVKSISFLTAMGPTPPRLPHTDKCRRCSLTTCQFRRLR